MSIEWVTQSILDINFASDSGVHCRFNVVPGFGLALHEAHVAGV